MENLGSQTFWGFRFHRNGQGFTVSLYSVFYYQIHNPQSVLTSLSVFFDWWCKTCLLGFSINCLSGVVSRCSCFLTKISKKLYILFLTGSQNISRHVCNDENRYLNLKPEHFLSLTTVFVPNPKQSINTTLSHNETQSGNIKKHTFLTHCQQLFWRVDLGPDIYLHSFWITFISWSEMLDALYLMDVSIATVSLC